MELGKKEQTKPKQKERDNKDQSRNKCNKGKKSRKRPMITKSWFSEKVNKTY